MIRLALALLASPVAAETVIFCGSDRVTAVVEGPGMLLTYENSTLEQSGPCSTNRVEIEGVVAWFEIEVNVTGHMERFSVRTEDYRFFAVPPYVDAEDGGEGSIRVAPAMF